MFSNINTIIGQIDRKKLTTWYKIAQNHPHVSFETFCEWDDKYWLVQYYINETLDDVMGKLVG